MTDPTKPESSVSAGQLTVREQRVDKGWAEALSIFQALEPLDLELATDYVKANPPSLDGVVFLAFIGRALDQQIRSERARNSAKAPRKSNVQQVIDAKVTNIDEFHQRLPELAIDLMGKGRGQKPLYDLITKANRKR